MTKPTRSSIDSLADLIAASREITDRQIASLNTAVERTNASVERTNQNIDLALEGIRQSAERMERSALQMQASADRIEHQVGVMSEHLTAIDIKIERLIDAMSAHLRISEKQTDNIAELTRLVATQANTVAALIQGR